MSSAAKAIAAQGLARRALSLGVVKALDQGLQFLLPIVLVRCLDAHTFVQINTIQGRASNDIFAGGAGGLLLHYDGTSSSQIRTSLTGSPIQSLAVVGRYVIPAAGSISQILERTSLPSGACAATETACTDAIDDDCDFVVDCADPDCRANAACAP